MEILSGLTFNNPFEIKITNPELLKETKEKQLTQIVTEKSETKHKIALVVDTNVLVKQTRLRELLKVPDQALFEQLFDVFTLEEVIKEVKDEQARKYIETGLEFKLQIK